MSDYRDDALGREVDGMLYFEQDRPVRRAGLPGVLELLRLRRLARMWRAALRSLRGVGGGLRGWMELDGDGYDRDTGKRNAWWNLRAAYWDEVRGDVRTVKKGVNRFLN